MRNGEAEDASIARGLIYESAKKSEDKKASK